MTEMRREPSDGFGCDDWSGNMPIPIDRDELASLRARAAEVDALRAERDQWRSRATQISELADLREAAHATIRARVVELEGVLRDARLQLEYMDERSPSGTTPTMIARIGAALKGAKP